MLRINDNICKNSFKCHKFFFGDYFCGRTFQRHTFVVPNVELNSWLVWFRLIWVKDCCMFDEFCRIWFSFESVMNLHWKLSSIRFCVLFCLNFQKFRFIILIKDIYLSFIVFDIKFPWFWNSWVLVHILLIRSFNLILSYQNTSQFLYVLFGNPWKIQI